MNSKRILMALVVLLGIGLVVPAGAVGQASTGVDDAPEASEAELHGGQRDRIVVRDISFENEGGTVVGTLTIPAGRRHRVPTVLLLHGFTGTRSELPILGTDDFMFVRAARVFAEAGIASLAIDFRGSGDSDGTFDETTFSGQISDALAAMDYLDRRQFVDDRRIGMLGFSQGGLVAAAVAAEDRRVRSLAMWSPVANSVDTYKTLLGEDNVLAGLEQETTHIVLPFGTEIDLNRPFFEDLYNVDPIAEISHYRGPLQVVVGLRDTLVTPQPYYGELYLTYHEGREELVTVDADHIFDVLTDAGPEVLDVVLKENLDFFQSTLGRRRR